MTDTQQRILDAARATLQGRGYNGLSFRDLAKDVGIKSASIHYYFPTKGDLGGAVARRYTDQFAAYLDDVLAASPDPHTCITKYTDVFRTTLLNENRMCLGGIMAAERTELPPEVQGEVVRFSEMNVRWLTQVLSLPPAHTNQDAIQHRALAIYAAVAGAQLIARCRNDVAVYDIIITTYRTTGLLP
jgi:TetR/AcrR family transcriptional repressor of nem operon